MPGLSELSVLALGRGIGAYIRDVSDRSFALLEEKSSSGPQEAERQASCYVEEAVKRLQEHLFGSVPWYSYQNLVEMHLQVLTDMINNSKALYRYNQRSIVAVNLSNKGPKLKQYRSTSNMGFRVKGVSLTSPDQINLNLFF